jgi:hypothetical protein
LSATGRRQRKTDPLASPAAARSINDKLRAAPPDLIRVKAKSWCECRAARHTQRYSATDTKRGRPGKWKREVLLRMAAHLGDILDRETPSHISFSSFIDHYLRMPDFPSDIIEVLESGDINLFEAEQLARVTSVRLGVSMGQAKRTRSELLSSHLQTKASGERLRQRVNELLRASSTESGQTSGDQEDCLKIGLWLANYLKISGGLNASRKPLI